MSDNYNNYPLLEAIPNETSTQIPLFVSIIASASIHGLLAVGLPLLPPSEAQLPSPVPVIELSAEEQNRLPILDPQFTFATGSQNYQLPSPGGLPIMPPPGNLPPISDLPPMSDLPPISNLPTISEEPSDYSLPLTPGNLPSNRDNSIIFSSPSQSQVSTDINIPDRPMRTYIGPSTLPSVDNLPPLISPPNNFPVRLPPPPQFTFSPPTESRIITPYNDNTREDYKSARELSPDMPLPSKEAQEKLAKLDLKPDVFQPGINYGDPPNEQPSPSPTNTPNINPSPAPSATPAPSPAAQNPKEFKGSILANLQQKNQEKPPTPPTPNNPQGIISERDKEIISAGNSYLVWAEKIQGNTPNLKLTRPILLATGYPGEACPKKVDGKVLVGLAINPDGKILAGPNLLVKAEEDALNNAAISAVKSIKLNENLPKEPTAYQFVFDFKYSEELCRIPAAPTTPKSEEKPQENKNPDPQKTPATENQEKPQDNTNPDQKTPATENQEKPQENKNPDQKTPATENQEKPQDNTKPDQETPADSPKETEEKTTPKEEKSPDPSTDNLTPPEPQQPEN